jgi:starch phosphorylase
VLRVWEATVGRVKVFLLDTNHPLNRAADRGLAGELYGSGTETRLQQEILLGIGGCRLLRQLEIRPQIFHINEGHAAFAALERARLFMLDHDIGIREALRAVRPGNLFTTHTPVEAGFDRFPPGLIRQYLGSYVAGLGMELDEFLALGRVDAGNANEPFNMAYLALRTCGAANAVSRLHTVVSKRLFAPVFPGTPLPDVPVEGVTNAVHVPSWLSPDSHRFWSERLGSGCWSTPRADDRDAARAEGGRRSESGPATASGGVLLGSDEELWSLRCHNRERLVEAVRTHIAGRHGDPWRPCKEGQRPIDLLDPAFLTLGFARRFAGYKRCTLLLRDPDRLARILSDEHRPVQLIVAGKAHPSDNEGKEMIHAWAQFSRREDVLRRVAFLVDYDMALARAVVQGVDVWINNPRRPLEASGTSGMKVVANGGLNLSELDGWWAEAYSPERGWPIGDTIPEDIDCVTIDELEADQLYSRLEEHVIPLFYERDSRGIPEGWLRMMRGSMEGLAFRFSADRMVADYVDRFYAPGALACEERMAGQADLAVDLERWCDKVRRLLPGVVASHVVAADEDGLRRFEVAVLPYDLKEEFVSGSLAVEMYAEPEGTILEPPLLVPLRLKAEDEDTLLFVGELRSDRPSGHFTARVRPAHAQAFGGLEMPSPHWLHTPTAG